MVASEPPPWMCRKTNRLSLPQVSQVCFESSMVWLARSILALFVCHLSRP
jgi:hypothetical protein